ncbi:hypothetical protein PQO03_08700 [Lentisphaera profundi]|uniref:Glutathione gamma-glutamylcysteinyltransferase n=1 Tax=Lentisphaera profundi TaxID=1658616 RepID=A0ABY7VNT4_9BACT|nr:hypothetical protein [Lentisphaera profundi]WDE95793.1 hypothetical protein PQO03_08700 [Lentisphaera profundi]
MKILISSIISLFISSCISQSTPGELIVTEYDIAKHKHLLMDVDYHKITKLENEINDRSNRGDSVHYYLESITMDHLNKKKFLYKKINAEISSYKQLSFMDINDSINLLVSEYKEQDELDYSKALHIFRQNITNYHKNDDIIIFNISRDSFYKSNNETNTFCIMQAFDEINHNVLLIEINNDKQSKYWVHYKNLFDGIMTKRNLSYSSSGWLKLSKDSFQNTRYYSTLP